MRLCSTKGITPGVSFREALFQGQAADGGLFIPESFPRLDVRHITRFADYSYTALATELASRLLGDEIDEVALENICREAYTFSPSLHTLNSNLLCLELFHGPTFSFKDFGAQFMAKAMGHFARHRGEHLTILVATSGDTGSAVAHAYYGVEGIRIVLLYPSGKVSPLQEKQFTTLGGNVCAIEVLGTFDDCQAMTKRAFADPELTARVKLTSANSINIGRLIPQSFYYVWAVSRAMVRSGREVVVCVPSGNFGNLTAGFFAKRMGLPVKTFVAAVNANAVIPEYLATGEYRPRPSIRTYSNAMDVGDPSNWERIRALCNDDYRSIAEELWSTSVSDDDTVATMRRVWMEYEYVVDPHTAVGLKAVERFRSLMPWSEECMFVSLSTAHPGKFVEIVELALQQRIPLPEPLEVMLSRDKRVTVMRNEYSELKEYLTYSSVG